LLLPLVAPDEPSFQLSVERPSLKRSILLRPAFGRTLADGYLGQQPTASDA
jgi:hypothetical protein